VPQTADRSSMLTSRIGRCRAMTHASPPLSELRFRWAETLVAQLERSIMQSPSSQRRGGRDKNKMARSFLCWSGRGGQTRETLHSAQLTTFKASRCRVCASRPSARNKVASQLLLDRASTPARRGMLPLILLLSSDFQTDALSLLRAARRAPLYKHIVSV
jgi:hypothetical protein